MWTSHSAEIDKPSKYKEQETKDNRHSLASQAGILTDIGGICISLLLYEAFHELGTLT